MALSGYGAGLEVTDSNPFPCQWMGLCSVVLNSTPCLVNSHLVNLQLVWTFNKFLFNYKNRTPVFFFN